MIATRAAGNPFMSRSLLSLAGAAVLALVLAAPTYAQEAEPAAEAEPHSYPIHKPEQQAWTFAGFFGKFDTAQVQRGYQVYREVCANCHSMKLVAFRHLGEEGGPNFSEAEVRALAAEFQVTDGPDDAGDMFQRPGRPSDYLPSPFPNDQAAAAANGGAVPPDLSLMAKARGIPRGVIWATLDFFTQYQEGGPDYIHALLTGYDQQPPAGVTVPEGTHYNPYFAAGPSLAMPKPLTDGQVTYADGTPGTVDQYARDVSAFLMWAAEPHLADRKRVGFQVFIFLIVFAGLLYMTKQKVWAGVAH
jgi:ubiquinol-cytochrome c reductase cytochrome c1 subunit